MSLVNLLDHGMSLQGAGDAPRIYHTGSSDPDGHGMNGGGTVYVEPGYPRESLEELERRGHRVVVRRGEMYGGFQAVRWDSTHRVWIGASESRKDGQAAGY